MRLTHLADYAVVLMTAAARRPAGARLSATELSGETGVPLPTAQKLMGQLAACGPADQRARRRRRLRAGAAGGRDQPRRHRRGGRRADRDDHLLGTKAIRLRARRALPGQAAHGRRRQCRARRAGRGEPDVSGGRHPTEGSRNERGRQEPRAQGEDRPGLRMGLLVRHRAGVRAQGPERRHRPLHLGQEERARVDARLAAQGLSRLARDGGGQLGQARHPARSITRTLIITPRPRRKPKLGSLDEVDPEILRVYEKLGIPIEEQKVLAGVEGARKVAVDAVFDSVSRRHHLPRGTEEGRGHLPLHLRGDPRVSRAGPEISRQRRPAARQLFRLPQQRGLLRRHLRLRARGRPLPDGAVAPISASMPRTPASSSAP